MLKEKNENKILRIFVKYPAFPILWFYLFCVLCGQCIMLGMGLKWYILISILLPSLLFSLVMLYVVDYLSKFKILKSSVWKEKEIKYTAVFVFVTAIVLFTAKLIVEWPMVLNDDCHNQFEQAVSGEYSNWHPVLHTLLFFTIPVKLRLGIGGIGILQIIWFSSAFTYLVYVLMKNGMPKLWLVAMTLYAYSIMLISYIIIPWKDIAFMIFGTVLVAYLIQIVCSEGGWLSKKRNIILFAVMSTICMLMRHNGVLFVAPLVLICLCFNVKQWKTVMNILLAILLSLAAVKTLYMGLNVTAPDKRTVETVGLPATIWCNVMKNDPKALPEETQTVMYQIAPPKIYAGYRTGSFNSIKWNEQFNLDAMDNLSYTDVFKYTYQCFKYAPESSFEAFCKCTRIVWSIIPDFKRTATAFVAFGYTNLLLIAVGVYLLSRKRLSAVYCLPQLCYNFATMLLLSTYGDVRFFFINIPISFATVFLMLRREKTKGSDV